MSTLVFSQYVPKNEFSSFQQDQFFQFSQKTFVVQAQKNGEGEGFLETPKGFWAQDEQIGKKKQKSENFSFFSEKRENFYKGSPFEQKSLPQNGPKNSSFATGRLSETQKQQQVVSITYEEIGLFPRSFNRVFDRFFKQLFFDVENFVIQEYRFYRYLFLTTVKCLFILLFVPLSINFLAKNYFIRPITEYFWNTQNHEIFLNSYQQKRAFSEFKNFEEKIYFESFLFSESANSFLLKKEFSAAPSRVSSFDLLPLRSPPSLELVGPGQSPGTGPGPGHSPGTTKGVASIPLPKGLGVGPPSPQRGWRAEPAPSRAVVGPGLCPGPTALQGKGWDFVPSTNKGLV
jgi:hypothetical protein